MPGEGKTLREKWIDSGSESGMTKNCHAELVSASSRRGRILSNLIGGQTLNQVQGDKIIKNLLTSKKVAFTLAEVLITLAIIGVVATMTIPTLISDYNKSVAEVKLSKFNAMLAQVVKLSSIDNGPINSWDTSDTENFYESYMAPYLRVSKSGFVEDSNFAVHLQDGSGFYLYSPGNDNVIHLRYFTNISEAVNNIKTGVNSFVFQFFPVPASQMTKSSNYCNSTFLGEGTGFVPYFYYYSDNDYWDNERNCRVTVYPTSEEMKTVLMNHSTYGCAKSGAYCTKLIQMNGWKIPDDYPLNF